MLGPAERTALLQEGVLLLDAEHRALVAVLLGHLDAECPGIGGVWGEVGQLDLTQHQDVVPTADRVRHGVHRAQHAVGVRAGRLVVLDPSKPQMSGSLPSATMRVLPRISGVGLVPSIQMYSAW